MPKIFPLGGEVDWPENEGVLGVIGVAPWATIEFLRAFYMLIPATKDWHFPRVVSDINTKLPSRGRHLQLGERDPSPFIAETLREMSALGVTVAVVPCNTAHLLYDRWASGSPIPVPHIVEETVSLSRAHGARTATPFTSASLAASDLYGKAIEASGMECYRVLPADQHLISALLEQVKVANTVSDGRLAELDLLCEKLKSEGVDTVLLGCTELSSLVPRIKHHGLKVFDSNVALAEKALQLVKNAAI